MIQESVKVDRALFKVFNVAIVGIETVATMNNKDLLHIAIIHYNSDYARMVESVDTRDLKSLGRKGRAGSSPALRTILGKERKLPPSGAVFSLAARSACQLFFWGGMRFGAPASWRTFLFLVGIADTLRVVVK